MFGYNTVMVNAVVQSSVLDDPGLTVGYRRDLGDDSSTFITPGAVHIIRKNDDIYALKINLAAGSAGGELVMFNSDGDLVWVVTADGSHRVAAGMGRFGHAPPASASSIEGVLSSVADANAKAVLTSIIGALTDDGGAVNATT